LKTRSQSKARPVIRRLNANQVEAFDAIVATGSITSAAKRLNISQPGVSRRLADLERAVGFSLFARDKKRLTITPEGQIFYHEVNQSFVGLNRLAQAANEIRQLRRGHISLWVMPALCFSIIPRGLKLFLDDNPALKVTFQAHSSQRIVEGIAAQNVDIGVAQTPADYPGIRIISSYSSQCVCVIPKNHRFAEKEKIGPRDLKGEGLVALPPNSMAGQALGRALARAGISIVPKIEALTSFAACAMVVEGTGVAVVDPFTAASFANHDIAIRPFSPGIGFNFQLVQPRDRIPSRATQSLIEYLAETIETHPLVRREAL
jgi:DNA-binding transcriptional LysR family regulator